MSIFRISPKVEEPTEAVPPPTEAASNLPADTPKEPGQVVPHAGFMAQKDIDASTIVLDGPLSRIYSQALNQAYAKENHVTAQESYIQELNAIHGVLEDKDERHGSYIYIMDGAEVEEADGFITAMEAFMNAKKIFNKVYLCFEHKGNITERGADLLTIARESGAIVLQDLDDVLSTVSDVVGAPNAN